MVDWANKNEVEAQRAAASYRYDRREMVAVPRTVPPRYMKVNVKARGPGSELSYTSRYGMVSERKAKDRFPISGDPQGEEPVGGKILRYRRAGVLRMGSVPDVLRRLIATHP